MTANSSSDLSPSSRATLPPSATLSVSRWVVLFSIVEATLSNTFSRLLWFLFPQPKTQWPKAGISSSSLQTSLQKRGETQEQLQSDRLVPPLHGTTTIVTGANAGIGYEIAKAQFAQGSHVFMACRSAERGRAARLAILRETRPALIKDEEQDERIRGPDLQLLSLDTSSKASVRAFVRQWKEVASKEASSPSPQIDFLFLNAGIAVSPDAENHFTDEGLEHMYATNFLGHHLLTALLSSAFSDSIRIIVTSSDGGFWGAFAHDVATQGPGAPSSPAELKTRQKDEIGFHFPASELIYNALHRPSLESVLTTIRYGQTKAMQVLFAHIVQARFDQAAKRNDIQRNKFIASFHPGLVSTNIFEPVFNAKTWRVAVSRFMLNVTALKPVQGAKAGLWLAHTYDAQPGGFYERNLLLAQPWYRFMTDTLADRLWQRWNNDAGLSEEDWHF